MTRLLMGTAALALSAGVASAEYTLHILHTNDMHSRIESINRFDSTCNAEDEGEGKCFGGVARVKTAIDAKKASLDNQNVVVLDAGDPFQGSLFYTTYKGAAEAEFMEQMGYDVMAVGNHEFDDGPAGLAGFVDAVSLPPTSRMTWSSTLPASDASPDTSRSVARKSVSFRRWPWTLSKPPAPAKT